jgi:hypothetical protein
MGDRLRLDTLTCRQSPESLRASTLLSLVLRERAFPFARLVDAWDMN